MKAKERQTDREMGNKGLKVLRVLKYIRNKKQEDTSRK